MKTVRLRPTGHAFIPGEPGEDEPGSGYREVSEAKAHELLSYNPPAFYRDTSPRETEPSTGPGENPGPLDSGKD